MCKLSSWTVFFTPRTDLPEACLLCSFITFFFSCPGPRSQLGRDAGVGCCRGCFFFFFSFPFLFYPSCGRRGARWLIDAWPSAADDAQDECPDSPLLGARCPKTPFLFLFCACFDHAALKRRLCTSCSCSERTCCMRPMSKGLLGRGETSEERWEKQNVKK